MATVCFILLCHRDADGVVAQARQLVAQGDCAVIHFDRGATGFAQIRRALRHEARIAFAPRRRCGWGDWSLVGASLAAARVGLRRFPDASHFYLLSGDCLPIAPARHLHQALDTDPADFIETQDFHRSGWIKTGLREERLIYRHPFNERRSPRLFYGALALQRRLGLRRRMPRGLQMRIGSQWFCLRRSTMSAVLAFLARRRDVQRFFRSVWIPDECAIQTLVWHLVPEVEIRNRPPTFLMFTDYGMPVVFHDDHHDLLVGQTGFFARKVSPHAKGLRDALWARWRAGMAAVPEQPDARTLHGYVTRRGRVGLRNAPRAWEAQAQPPPDAQIYVVVCKKWSVGKRMAQDLAEQVQAPALGYFFDELAPGDPDLGGLARDLARRHDDPPSLLAILLGPSPAPRMVLCLDPSQDALLQRLRNAAPDLRVLEVQCRFSDADLHGHASRLGLVQPGQEEAAAPIWPMLRQEMAAESGHLHNARNPGHFCLREGASAENLAQTIADFLRVPHHMGHDLARRPGLFHE